MRKIGLTLAESDALPFMICFCEEGFSSYYCYTIMNADDEKKYLSKEGGSDSLIMGTIAPPYGVTYTSRTGKGKADEEREYRLIFDMRKLIAGKERLLAEKYVYLDAMWEELKTPIFG